MVKSLIIRLHIKQQRKKYDVVAVGLIGRKGYIRTTATTEKKEKR